MDIKLFCHCHHITDTWHTCAALTWLLGDTWLDKWLEVVMSSWRAELELDSFLQLGAWCFTPLKYEMVLENVLRWIGSEGTFKRGLIPLIQAWYFTWNTFLICSFSCWCDASVKCGGSGRNGGDGRSRDPSEKVFTNDSSVAATAWSQTKQG